MIRHIVFRCLHCRGTTSVQAEWKRRDFPAEVVCADCNATYQLAVGRNRGVSNRDYYEKAQRFAAENGIDLPSAYSVLEGILPREKVRAFAKPSEPVVRPSTSLRTLTLFAAVVIGLAFLGGHFRERLELKPSLRNESKLPQTVRVGSIRQGNRPASPIRESQTTAYVPVVVQTDAAGGITKIAGPDPKNVLQAFCRQPGMGEALTPVTVSASTPPSPGLRLGVLRSIDDTEGLFSVKIWLDSATGRWTIGNGLTAIRPEPVSLDPGPPSPPAPVELTGDPAEQSTPR